MTRNLRSLETVEINPELFKALEILTGERSIPPGINKEASRRACVTVQAALDQSRMHPQQADPDRGWNLLETPNSCHLASPQEGRTKLKEAPYPS